jgi:hypothetical protein
MRPSVFLLLAFLLSCAVPLSAGANPSAEYSAAWQDFHALLKDSRKSENRNAWMALKDRFWKAYNRNTRASRRRSPSSTLEGPRGDGGALQAAQRFPDRSRLLSARGRAFPGPFLVRRRAPQGGDNPPRPPRRSGPGLYRPAAHRAQLPEGGHAREGPGPPEGDGSGQPEETNSPDEALAT